MQVCAGEGGLCKFKSASSIRGGGGGGGGEDALSRKVLLTVQLRTRLK